MAKVDAINNIKIHTSLIKNKKLFNKLITPPYALGAAVVGTAGVIVSSFLKDFNKTSSEDNYFQLKTNPETGKHYDPDIFQTAAAKNLYLGNDVLVTAPTGTGKTAIAHYIITKNLKEGGRTFYTTPLKALSNEKFRDFCKTYGDENVGIITGDTKINTDAPIIIMTTEVYRNMSANEIFEHPEDDSRGIPHNLKTVIFDELQYLGDIDRGGIWEQSIMFTPKDVQILSLSATIGNNIAINDWIASTKGRFGTAVTPDSTYNPIKKNIKETVLINVPSENRHVPLNFELQRVAAEMPKLRGGTKKQKIDAKKEAARKSQTIYAKPNDAGFKELTRKLNEEGKLPAIYFVFSKKDSNHLLKFLSTESELLTNEQEREEIARIIKEEYIDKNIYLGEGLNTTALMKGYAIHNAGLLPNQKKLVEELFQKKLVKVVIATETLSAGINMPAKTTVISSPRKPASKSDGGMDKKRNLTPNEYHQMAGRAGRRGIDTVGYCYSITCNQEQSKFYQELINSPSNDLNSNLELDYSFIANYMAQSIDEGKLKDLLSKSLYVYDENKTVNKQKLKELVATYNVKKEILNNEGYLKNNGELSTKGKLIKYLNGYEQIPIINIIADRTLENLNAKQIAGIIGGLANIEYNTKGEFPQKPTEVRRQDDRAFVAATHKATKAVGKYAQATEALYPERELYLSTKVMDHLYSWADLNEKNEDSRQNWKDLYEGDLKGSIRDEGTLFKEITMTSDLLKQLIGVCEVGASVSEKHHDYYMNLADKLQEALELIQREPADERL